MSDVEESDSTVSKEEIQENEFSLNVPLLKVLQNFPILLQKNQLPETKVKKQKALQKLSDAIQLNCGNTTDQQKICKRIANMKMNVKKKTDANATGNKKIKLCQWEKDLFNLIHGAENPTVTKLTSSVSHGISSQSAKVRLKINKHRPKSITYSYYTETELLDCNSYMCIICIMHYVALQPSPNTNQKVYVSRRQTNCFSTITNKTTTTTLGCHADGGLV